MTVCNSVIPEISVEELAAELASFSADKAGSVFLLDVREREEFEFTSISGSTLIPMMEIEESMEKITESVSASAKTVVICRSGQRSRMVTEVLTALGLENIYNLAGGINAYSRVDSSVISY